MPANFSDIGNDLTNKQVVKYRRGRIGLMFWMCGFIFLYYGSNAIVHKPT